MDIYYTKVVDQTWQTTGIIIIIYRVCFLYLKF